MAALLHDASEAYMADVIRPIKYSIPELCIIENAIEVRILGRFKCFGADWGAIKVADNVMLATEGRDLMKRIDGWHLPEPPQEDTIVPWSADLSETAFLDVFTALMKERNESSSG